MGTLTRRDGGLGREGPSGFHSPASDWVVMLPDSLPDWTKVWFQLITQKRRFFTCLRLGTFTPSRQAFCEQTGSSTTAWSQAVSFFSLGRRGREYTVEEAQLHLILD